MVQQPSLIPNQGHKPSNPLVRACVYYITCLILWQIS
nr:MAG TPA: hypothetical protein [Caudoviricetes sp.]